MAKNFSRLMFISVLVFLVSFFIHLMLVSLFEIDDTFWVILGMVAAPAGFAVGIIGHMVLRLKNRSAK
ncbi:hypothetical protein [Dehalococcoides mccartyi]|uniref:Uncharacterized protein n=1 Tax=Dehalococcoides mccartyi (strain VS) TaxID=311424 RepID=D2BIM3_DEHMV|nr:hypothetical protein [Dehalococcoides mccartyi]ACZ62173.1 hypothetical protein DhcVS_1056 [Dehalococcoides mccartyi VS]AHB13876.1 hypothetical protein GY50_1105 [Dehalococcoides mccartyi GY50]